MTTAVATIVARAAKILQDEGLERWTEQELVDWLNEGQLALVKIKPDAKTTTRDLTLVPGSKQSVPEDCIDVVDVRQNKDGTAITPCERRALDTFSPNWMVRPTASTVKHWMRDENPGSFYVYPPQSATPATVVLTASTYPVQVGLGNNIDIRDLYAENLVNFVLYRAFSKDAEFAGAAQRAVAYYQAFAA